MALSPQVVQQVIEVSKLLPKDATVLSLGYPDILVDLNLLTKLGLEGLEPHQDSERKAKFYGRGNITVPTAESFFKSLGLSLAVCDLKDWDRITLETPTQTKYKNMGL